MTQRWVLGFHSHYASHQRLQRSLGLYDANARLQPSIGGYPVKTPFFKAVPPRPHLHLHHDRNEYFGLITKLHTIESRLSYSDHCHGVAVRDDRFAHDRAIGRETCLPEAVAEHCHWMTTGSAVIVRCQDSADCGRDA